MVYEGVDGRSLTDYRPNCDVEQLMKQAIGVGNNFDYRLYLQRNGAALIEANRQAAQMRHHRICNCPQCIRISNK